jgi:hypothetical protein
MEELDAVGSVSFALAVVLSLGSVGFEELAFE